MSSSESLAVGILQSQTYAALEGRNFLKQPETSDGRNIMRGHLFSAILQCDEAPDSIATSTCVRGRVSGSRT